MALWNAVSVFQEVCYMECCFIIQCIEFLNNGYGFYASQDSITSVSSKHFSKCGAALVFVLSDYSARTVK
jgi:hypothetical protein